MAGCTALPHDGADAAAIQKNATYYYPAQKKAAQSNYVLIDLTEAVLSYFPKEKSQSLATGFGPTRRGLPDLPLGIGDIVEVTLFESAAGGLFVPAEAGSRPGNFITLPPQTVSANGTISVPYAGQIQVAGRTTDQVQHDIETRLQDRAIEPQAVINLVQRRSSQMSVLGDVNKPDKLEITPAGERVLDMISRAGGITSPPLETTVTLQRGRTKATVAFNTLISDPRENILVYPNDTVYVSRERRTFLAFGASGLNGRIDFEEAGLSLAEGVGKAGGLLDFRADPRQVFLYRLVSPEILAKMGVPVTVKGSEGFPVIFRVNLRDPSGLFLARQFPMQDKDIIYVSNSDSVELSKFFDFINSTTSGTAGPLIDAAAAKTAVRVLRN